MDTDTGIQVAPVTEADMANVRSVFERAANSIVQASELAKVVADLKVEVTGLKEDIEKVRRANQALDEALTNVRTQRDEAQAQVREQAGQIDGLRHSLEDTTRDRDTIRHQYEAKVSELADMANRADGLEHRYGELLAQFNAKEEAYNALKAHAEAMAKQMADFLASLQPKPAPEVAPAFDPVATQEHPANAGHVGLAHSGEGEGGAPWRSEDFRTVA